MVTLNTTVCKKVKDNFGCGRHSDAINRVGAENITKDVVLITEEHNDMYVCLYVCMYVCAYIHIHEQTLVIQINKKS